MKVQLGSGEYIDFLLIFKKPSGLLMNTEFLLHHDYGMDMDKNMYLSGL